MTIYCYEWPLIDYALLCKSTALKIFQLMVLLLFPLTLYLCCLRLGLGKGDEPEREQIAGHPRIS